MGSYLLRSGKDESLLVGDLHLYVYDMTGLEFTCGKLNNWNNWKLGEILAFADIYVCVEVDFYGHFFQKAKTKTVKNTQNPHWNENFVVDLEGCENMRILVYRETGAPHDALFGKHTVKLSRSWLNEQQMVDKVFRVSQKICVS